MGTIVDTDTSDTESNEFAKLPECMCRVQCSAVHIVHTKEKKKIAPTLKRGIQPRGPPCRRRPMQVPTLQEEDKETTCLQVALQVKWQPQRGTLATDQICIR